MNTNNESPAIPAEPLGRDAEGIAVDGWHSCAEEVREHWIGIARRLRPQVDEAMVERAFAEWCRLYGHQPDTVRMRAALTAALTEADSHG